MSTRLVSGFRASVGLPPDPASDAIWADRIANGTATLNDAYAAINSKALYSGGSNLSDSSLRNVDQQVTEGFLGSGGGTGTGGSTAPEEQGFNYRDYAPPWMTGALLDQYVDHWARTGQPEMAMEAIRRSAEYDRVFVGNRREDGSLRYSEAQYMSTRDAFRETMAEFEMGGLDKATIEALFVNDVSAQEFFRGVGEAYSAFTEPGGETPQGLMREFLSGFTSTGSAQAGWAAARDSADYDRVFAGNRREDGSLRMSEQEYYGYKRGWQRTLVGYGLSPTEFESRGRFVEAVTGEVSIEELNQRLQSVQDGIMDNVDAVQSFYADNYGLDLTPESILGMAIDPGVQRDVLERRINASQIGGEAAIRGFSRSIDRAEKLARAGITQQQARNLYGQAEANLDALSATTQRYNRGRTSLTQFEEASALGDAAGQQRLTRALQEEQSNFSTRSDTRRSRDGLGLSGLQQR